MSKNNVQKGRLKVTSESVFKSDFKKLHLKVTAPPRSANKKREKNFMFEYYVNSINFKFLKPIPTGCISTVYCCVYNPIVHITMYCQCFTELRMKI